MTSSAGGFGLPHFPQTRASFFSRERTIAPPGFSRWLVPPAAIAVQMCIGEVYGFSVFNNPLAAVMGANVKHIVFGTYSLALVMLGLSAALLGKWVERMGPRLTMVTSAGCFCGGAPPPLALMPVMNGHELCCGLFLDAMNVSLDGLCHDPGVFARPVRDGPSRRDPRPTTRRCTSWLGFWWWGCSATWPSSWSTRAIT
jgi:hypothetical protein